MGGQPLQAVDSGTLWVGEEHIQTLLLSLTWILETLRTANLTGWYHLRENRPPGKVIKLAAEQFGNGTSFTPTPEQARAVAWEVLIVNNEPGQLERIREALETGMRQGGAGASGIESIERKDLGGAPAVAVIIPIIPISQLPTSLPEN
jgi:hypothetical protein